MGGGKEKEGVQNKKTDRKSFGEVLRQMDRQLDQLRKRSAKNDTG